MIDDRFHYASKNPGVFTDARCYMRWIAAQYGMKLKADHKVPSSCFEPKGNRGNYNQEKCIAWTDYYIEKEVKVDCPDDKITLEKKHDKITRLLSFYNEATTTQKGKVNRKGGKNVGGGKRQGNKKTRKENRNQTKEQNMKTSTKQIQNMYISCDEPLEKLSAQCNDNTIKGCKKQVKKLINYKMADDTESDNLCDFANQYHDKENTLKWDKCSLVAEEGFSYNVYRCKNKDGQIGICSNNCKGVDPNAIIIGGSAVLAASGVAVVTLGQAVLQAGLGATILGGGVLAGSQACRGDLGFCQVSWLVKMTFNNDSFSDSTEARQAFPVLQIKRKARWQIHLPKEVLKC